MMGFKLFQSWCLLVVAGITATVGKASENELPHLIFVLGDDTGWFNVGFNNPAMHTPTLDNLVKEGVRLERHYVFAFCSPTRSALMSGRLPIHVNQQNSAEWAWNSTPVHEKMTMLPKKLKTAGYTTLHVGKWHLGLAKPEWTPYGRGFDHSLGFLSGSEEHFSQLKGCEGSGISGKFAVDLWEDDKPGYDLNGTYSAILYTERVVKAIEEQPQGKPFFAYVALQVTHEPEEAPPQYYEPFYPASQPHTRRLYNGMATAMDEAVKNITVALKSNNMWENTLLVFSADNGGPSLCGPVGCPGNNYPLRGCKGTAFDGGVRAAAFVAGGLIPTHARGSSATGYAHICDWYTTMCKLAGVDPRDDNDGIPSIDSVDLWPLIVNNTKVRMQVPLQLTFNPKSPDNQIDNAALIQGDMKYVYGRQVGGGLWWGPDFPNASSTNISFDDPGCPQGCLFNITADPSEYSDVSSEYPDVFEQMKKEIEALVPTVFQSDINGSLDYEGAIAACKSRYNLSATGDWWWGPWLE